jgi:hypothetical protein
MPFMTRTPIVKLYKKTFNKFFFAHATCQLHVLIAWHYEQTPLELSFDSAGDLVKSWLFAYKTFDVW